MSWIRVYGNLLAIKQFDDSLRIVYTLDLTNDGLASHRVCPPVITDYGDVDYDVRKDFGNYVRSVLAF